MYIQFGRKFKSRPKWYSVTSTMIEKYKNKLDSLLMLIQLPFTVLHCENVLCTTHDIVIESLYDSIIIICTFECSKFFYSIYKTALKILQTKDSRLERLCKTFLLKLYAGTKFGKKEASL